MGSTFSEIENGIHIRLANNDLVKCNPIEASYTTQLLYCKTAEANVGSGPVVVSISGGASLTATSKKTFSFYVSIISYKDVRHTSKLVKVRERWQGSLHLGKYLEAWLS